MNIRSLKNTDVISYRKLRLKSLLEAPFSFSDSYNDLIKESMDFFTKDLITTNEKKECYVLGAFSGQNELIGFAKFKRDTREKARHKSMIHIMYVDPNFRNKSVGSLLIKKIICRARRLNGLEQIHIWVLDAGSTAKRFYEKCGFICQGPMVKKDLKIEDVYIDAQYMVMHL